MNKVVPVFPELPFFEVEQMGSFLKYLVLFVGMISTSLVVFAEEHKKTNAAECEKYIQINGTSNVNSFSLVSNKLYLTNADQSGQLFSRKVLVPVDEFYGERKPLLNDFQEMIKAGEHPFIFIAVTSEISEEAFPIGQTVFNAEITVAGATRKYKIPCQVSPCQNSGWQIEGSLEIKLTDFGIEPPEKVFGMVKVDNEVFINFAFVFQSELLTEKTKS